MKGIILAGGTGSRLSPLTNVTNKHLLSVYDEPMIYNVIKALTKSGVNDITIVLGGESVGDFIKLLGDGTKLNENEIGNIGLKYATNAEEAIKKSLKKYGKNAKISQ